MRVLVTSTSGVGHVHPMVPLARALAERGHQVRWATAPEACERVAHAGIDVVPAGVDLAPRMAEYHRRFPEAATLAPEDLAPHMFPRLFGAVTAPPMLDDLAVVCESWRPDLIVHDAAELAAPLIATSLGVPNVCHGFGSIVPASRVADAAEWLDDRWRARGFEPERYGGCYDHLYIDIFPPALGVDDTPHIPRRQPLRPVAFDESSAEGLPDGLLDDPDRPLVYLTFGTVFTDSEIIRTPLDAVCELDARVLVTVGPGGDPDALGPQPSNVSVVRYVPQTQLLPHCDAVVSHSGSGTFLAALSLGIPQLCLPRAADQFRNAATGAKAGAALSLLPHEVSRSAVRGAVERLLAGPGFAERAWIIGESIAEMPSPDEVAAVVEALA